MTDWTFLEREMHGEEYIRGIRGDARHDQKDRSPSRIQGDHVIVFIHYQTSPRARAKLCSLHFASLYSTNLLPCPLEQKGGYTSTNKTQVPFSIDLGGRLDRL